MMFKGQLLRLTWLLACLAWLCTAQPASAQVGGEQVYRIVILTDQTQADAERAKSWLESLGYAPIVVEAQGGRCSVLYGNFSTEAAAGRAREGLQTDGIKTRGIALGALIPAAPAPTPTPATPALAQAPAQPLPSEITSSDEWKKLSDEDRRQVLKNILIQEEMSQGDSKLAGQLMDIEKQVKGLKSQVNDIVTKAAEAKRRADQARQEINSLFGEAENLIRSAKYKEAIAKLRDILSKDPYNEFGQNQFVQRRIAFCESRLNGENYEGQGEDIAKQYAVLKEQAETLSRSTDLSDMDRAINFWYNIAQLDKNKYGKEADEHIKSLNSRKETAQADTRQAEEQAKKQMMTFAYGLAGAVAVVIVLLVVVWLRGRKRHLELMRKVQEITSIRPMRELEGANASQPLLAGATESDIFAPRAPMDENLMGDPLGGLSDGPAPSAKPAKKGKAVKAAAPAPAPEPSPLDDVFGGGTPAPATASVGGGMDDMGFDDIFGGGAPQAKPAVAEPVTAKAEPAPTAASSDVDDIFGNLFAEESPSTQAPAPEPAAESKKEESVGPISFDDLVAVSSGHEDVPKQEETSPAEKTSDLLSMFDDAFSAPAGGNGGSASSAPAAPAPVADDPLQDSPFASLFGDVTSPAETESKDDTEIPSVKLDFGGSTTVNSAFDSTADLPAFSFDDVISAPMEGGLDATSPLAGVELSFESETAGQKPSGWEGEYPYAALTVAADTPPKGTAQYLLFDKKDGAGKALYSYSFAKIGGMVGIEFDLRCNDKNKFLLGFYIEKDGDFQQAIHTKILRSEAQTTPTIHMQGESAPYLLGSWAHIKYVANLTTGTINGWIDGTHVVRDLPLPTIPDYLSTLSIRDNINTTGNLMLANIKIYKVQ